jgi:hypothetical protein
MVSPAPRADAALRADQDPIVLRLAKEIKPDLRVDEGPLPDVDDLRDPACEIRRLHRLQKRRVCLALDQSRIEPQSRRPPDPAFPARPRSTTPRHSGNSGSIFGRRPAAARRRRARHHLRPSSQRGRRGFATLGGQRRRAAVDLNIAIHELHAVSWLCGRRARAPSEGRRRASWRAAIDRR